MAAYNVGRAKEVIQEGGYVNIIHLLCIYEITEVLVLEVVIKKEN